MGGQPLGEIGDTGLGRRVGGDLGQRGVGVHGGDVQDATTAPGYHILSEGLGGQEGALEVELEDEVHPVGLQVEEGFATLLRLVLILVVGGSAGIVAAGAVDEDVTETQIRHHGLVHSRQHGGIQDVGLVALTGKALGAQFVGQRLDGILVEVQSGDLGARLGERASHGGADQAPRAGDDDDLAGVVDIQRKI